MVFFLRAQLPDVQRAAIYLCILIISAQPRSPGRIAVNCSTWAPRPEYSYHRLLFRIHSLCLAFSTIVDVLALTDILSQRIRLKAYAGICRTPRNQVCTYMRPWFLGGYASQVSGYARLQPTAMDLSTPLYQPPKGQSKRNRAKWVMADLRIHFVKQALSCSPAGVSVDTTRGRDARVRTVFATKTVGSSRQISEI